MTDGEKRIVQSVLEHARRGRYEQAAKEYVSKIYQEPNWNRLDERSREDLTKSLQEYTESVKEFRDAVLETFTLEYHGRKKAMNPNPLAQSALWRGDSTSENLYEKEKSYSNRKIGFWKRCFLCS